MILDTLENAQRYFAAVPGLAQAVAAIAAFDKERYPTGRTDIDGARLFMLANAYEPKPLTGDSLMEAHRTYLDVMYMVRGEETIYVKPTANLSKPVKAYDAQGDALLAGVDDDCTQVLLAQGQFVVLFPQDAHCPAIARQAPSVRKIICKLAVDF